MKFITLHTYKWQNIGFHEPSLSKPRDAKLYPWDGFFYPILTLMIDSYILQVTSFK